MRARAPPGPRLGSSTLVSSKLGLAAVRLGSEARRLAARVELGPWCPAARFKLGLRLAAVRLELGPWGLAPLAAS